MGTNVLEEPAATIFRCKTEAPGFSKMFLHIYKTTWHHSSVLLTLFKDSCLFGLSEPEGGGTILFQNVGSY
jgi:hypothetical protein